MVAWEQQHCRIPASVPLGSLAAGKACPCSRMESVVAQFVTMLAHQSVCQTIVAFFASLRAHLIQDQLFPAMWQLLQFWAQMIATCFSS